MNAGRFAPGPRAWMARNVPTLAAALVGFALAITLLLAQLASLTGPLVGEHDWRQSDTYSVAYNFVHVSSNFMLPRIDMTNGLSGVQGMETPLYPFLLSLLMRVFGDAPTVGRSFTCALGLAGMMQACLWLRPRGSKMWMVWPLALLSSPMYLYELRQIQPDPALAAFAMMSAAQLVAFRRTSRWRHFALGWVFALAMALTKAPGVILLPVMWTFSWPEHRFRFWRWFGTGVALALPALLSFGWYKWGQHLNTTYNAGEVYFAAEFSWPAIQADLSNHGNLIRFFCGVCTAYVINWALLPVALVGFVVGFKREHRHISLSMTFWLAMWTFFCAGFSSKMWWHWYYATPLVVPVAYFVTVATYEALAVFDARTRGPHAIASLVALGASFGLVTFVGGPPVDAHHTPGSGGDVLSAVGAWGWVAPINLWILLATLGIAGALSQIPAVVRLREVIVVVVLAVCSRGFDRVRSDSSKVLEWRAATRDWARYQRTVPPLRAAVDRFSTRDDVFVVDFGENPAGLHRANRRGFVAPSYRLTAQGWDYYRARGARFFVHFEAEPLANIASVLPRLARGEGWELYCLAKEGCLPR